MLGRQDHQSRVFYELSSLVLSILRSTPSQPIQFSDEFPSDVSSSSSSSSRPRAPVPQITPAGFASLMLGISLSMMLCGSLTFFIGFMLFPWVIGLFMVFYFVSGLSVLGRAFICYAISPSPPPPSPRKDIPAWKFL